MTEAGEGEGTWKEGGVLGDEDYWFIRTEAQFHMRSFVWAAPQDAGQRLAVEVKGWWVPTYLQLRVLLGI